MAAFGLFVLIGVIAGIAGTASHTVTTGTAGQAGSSQSATASASSSASSSPARVGSTLTLTGNDPGEKMAVTVTRVVSHAQPADEFSSPDPGKRFYAVQFRLADTGTTAYSDSPSNGAAVVDSAGQSYQSSIYNVAGCASRFPAPRTSQRAKGARVRRVPGARWGEDHQGAVHAGLRFRPGHGPVGRAQLTRERPEAPRQSPGWRGVCVPGAVSHCRRACLNCQWAWHPVRRGLLRLLS